VKKLSMRRNINFIAACLVSALHEMRTHKLRSFLSILGVMIGIASFLLMLSLSDMSMKTSQAFLDEIGGANQIEISNKQTASTKEALLQSRSRGLRTNELDSLCNNIEGLNCPFISRGEYGNNCQIGNETYECGYVGINPFLLAKYKMVAGRPISLAEYKQGRAVCLLPILFWKKIAKNRKCSAEEFIGTCIYGTGNHIFEVVGIFSQEFMPSDWSEYKNGIFIPNQYFEKRIGLPHQRGWDWVGVRAGSFQNIALIKERITQELISMHRGVVDFKFNKEDWIAKSQENTKKMNLTFMIITLLSLFVGGLNIMNVMMASISTRIREIGMRQAIGATPFQIFLQFMLEASFLSCVGGILGCALGIILTQLTGDAISKSFPMLIKVGLDPKNVVIGITVSALEGILFGLYPAIRAVRMNPVTALHYE